MNRGANLRQYRLMAGLSQDELAELAGVAQKTVWELEAGRSNGQGRTWRKLAKALGKEPPDFWKEPA